ncbi:hypothetical protein EDB81DRAFT_899085 [Dactylonectria macrodidyma]|uniref:Uncharacterized protein n=1 Tax=Dactylonectria macrodidyma TaxID=307937 RepID=A0A9P9IZM0_9HYPO|nr:hypothetical protein EDB81DRAFT_899085 [Dactylonectria macrodidyma]
MKQIIALAEHGGYFLGGPGYRYAHNVPDWFRQIISTTPEVCCVAFGPGDAAVVTYLDGWSGRVQLVMKNISSMPGLAAWLLDRDDRGRFKGDLRRLEVSFGQDGSYWASDGQTHIHHELPEKLEQDLRTLQTEAGPWNDSPRFIGLGAEGNYILVTGHGAVSSRLGAYPHVFHALNAIASAPTGLTAIQGICLSHFQEASVVQWVEGSLQGYNLSPELVRDIEQVNHQVSCAQAAQAMAQERLRQDIFQAQAMQQTRFAHEEAAVTQMYHKMMECQQWNAKMSARAGGATWVEADEYGRPRRTY